MSRINHTILIDDNKTTNFLNKYLMLKSKRFKRIEEFINGHKVLERFEKDQSFEPDIIFFRYRYGGYKWMGVSREI
ncbi:hypothetical protein [uncultured Aquimarina sp.]|uniref:hypothetical protein n=1 Tax=uncultured Aquimarina sp. TaxID=575652 RepID=UPI00262A34A5|nr:hypothetical protein [uncultured Aquimarina sp.]